MVAKAEDPTVIGFSSAYFVALVKSASMGNFCKAERDNAMIWLIGSVGGDVTLRAWVIFKNPLSHKLKTVYLINHAVIVIIKI